MTPTYPIFNRLMFLLSVIGAGVAGYLWWLHMTHVDIPCGGSGGCEIVAASKYARFPEGTSGPFYVAAWGTLGYIVFAVLAFLRTLEPTPARDKQLLGLLVFGTIAATVFSLRLTYIELFVIHAVCKWCIGSQIIVLSLAAISLTEWFTTRRAPREGISER